MKTFAMALSGLPYRSCIKPKLPKDWFDELPHTHVALDDALEQGALFCNMLSLWQQHRQALGLPNEVMPSQESEEVAVPGVSPRISSD